MLIRCEQKLKLVFLKITSWSGWCLSGWRFWSCQKPTCLLLDLSVLDESYQNVLQLGEKQCPHQSWNHYLIHRWWSIRICIHTVNCCQQFIITILFKIDLVVNKKIKIIRNASYIVFVLNFSRGIGTSCLKKSSAPADISIIGEVCSVSNKLGPQQTAVDHPEHKSCVILGNLVCTISHLETLDGMCRMSACWPEV